MLFDQYGRGEVFGQTVKELVWDVIADSALPSWLELTGVSPEVAFSGPGASRGTCTVSTKSGTPTDGDTAGIRPAFDIDMSQFSEVGFYVYSLSYATVTNLRSNLMIGDGSTTGAVMSNGTNVDQTAAFSKVQPSGPELALDWTWVTSGVGTDRKNIGMTVRPLQKQVWFTQGDHVDRDVPVGTDIGNWANGLLRPQLQIVTKNAAAKSFTFSKIKLRLAHL
jgi:hypothetical protein